MTATHRCARCAALTDVRALPPDLTHCWACGGAMFEPLPPATVARVARAAGNFVRPGVERGTIAGHIGKVRRAGRPGRSVDTGG